MKAERHRDEIVEASAGLLRERGLRGVSVADLMGAVGLTHGGFYNHFESKDALILEAVSRAYDEAARQWCDCSVGKMGIEARHALLDQFLNADGVQAIGMGCPSISLVVDIARESIDAPVRKVFHHGLERLLAILAEVEPGHSRAESRNKALTDYAMMVGLMVLALATAGLPLSNELLVAVREQMMPAPEEIATGIGTSLSSTTSPP